MRTACELRICSSWRTELCNACNVKWPFTKLAIRGQPDREWLALPHCNVLGIKLGLSRCSCKKFLITMESLSHQRKPGTDIVCCIKSLWRKWPRGSKPVGSKELLVSRCFDFSVVMRRIQGNTTNLMMQVGRTSREIEGVKQYANALLANCTWVFGNHLKVQFIVSALKSFKMQWACYIFAKQLFCSLCFSRVQWSDHVLKL